MRNSSHITMTPAICTKPFTCPHCGAPVNVGERIAFDRTTRQVRQSISGRTFDKAGWRPRHADYRVCVQNQRDAEKARFDAETEETVASIVARVPAESKAEIEAGMRAYRASEWAKVDARYAETLRIAGSRA